MEKVPPVGIYSSRDDYSWDSDRNRYYHLSSGNGDI
jgi:hypothetical protein